MRIFHSFLVLLGGVFPLFLNAQVERELPPSFHNAVAMPLPQWKPPKGRNTPGPKRAVTYNAITKEVRYDSIPSEPAGILSLPGNLPALQGIILQGDRGIVPFSFSNLTRVTNTSIYPWSAQVKFLMTWPDGNQSSCSGAMIDPKHILTCGHCIYSIENGGWAEKITVVPGYDDGNVPFGTSEMISMTTFEGWTVSEDYNDDIAVIRVDRPVGALSGWNSISWDESEDFYTSNTFHNPGYPGGPAYNGQTMQYWYGNYDEVIYETPRHYNRAYGGQSGSNSWRLENGFPTAYAVLSHGHDDPPSWTGHVRINEYKFNDFVSFINNHTPNRADLIPLSVVTSPKSVKAGEAISSFSFFIHNYSSSAFSGTINYKIYLSSNPSITSSDTEIWSGYISSASIEAKGTTSSSFRSNFPTIPFNTPPGLYYLGVLITNNDANNNNNGTSDWDVWPINVTSNVNLSAGPSSLNFVGGGESKTFNVTSNTNWTVAESLSWLSVSPSSGSNNGNVTVTAQANPSTSSRSGSISVSASGAATQTITVSQTAAPALTVSSNTLSFSANGGNQMFSITTNTSWTVSSSTSWLTLSPASGTNNRSVTVTAAAYTGSSARTAVITVSGTGVPAQTIALTQAGVPAACAVPPKNLRLDRTGYSSFIVRWDSLPGVTAYSWRRRFANETTWTSTNDNWVSTGLVTSNQLPCTEYVLQVRAVCEGGVFGPWSPELLFKLDGCGDPYCYSYGIATNDWMSSIDFVNVMNISGRTYGYGNFTQQQALVEKGKPYPITLRASHTNSSQNETYYWNVWIDWNQDREFADTGERVLAQTTARSASVNGVLGNITIPTTATRGQTRMRVALSMTETSDPCARGGNRDVQDYNIEISEPAAMTLSVSPTTLNFLSGGETKTFAVSANTSWMASSSQTWLSLSLTSGSNNGSISVTAQPHTGSSSRSATITVSGTGALPQTISVTQSAPIDSLNVQPTFLRFSASTGAQKMRITSNVNWTASTPTAWLTLDKSNSAGNGDLTLTAIANTSTQERSGVVTIRGGSLIRTVNVVQDPGGPPLPISWTFKTTENSHTVILTNSLDSDIEGKPIAVGDYVGIFFQQNGKDICAGYGVWTGRNTSFPVFGDDADTPEKEGLSTGELFLVKVWQTAVQQELDAIATYAPPGTQNIVNATDRYLTDGFSMLTSLKASSSETLIIPLKGSWNTISSYLVPKAADLEVLMANVPAVQVIKDASGKTYITDLKINGIGNWKVTEGYRVRAASETELRLSGKAIDPQTTPIPIRTGWQIIPVFSRAPQPLTEALAGILNLVEVVKENKGQVYLPEFGIDNIGTLSPTQGYRLKAKAAGELRYSAEGMLPVRARAWGDVLMELADTPQYFSLPQGYNTGMNATLVFLAVGAGDILQTGDEIGIFAGDTLLCGAGKYTGINLAITVWGDDADSTGRQGMLPGERYKAFVWKAAENKIYPLTLVFAQGKDTYQEDDVAIIQGLSLFATSVAEKNQDRAIAIFPNPSNGNLTLITEMALTGPAQVRIINISGQVVWEKRFGNGMSASVPHQIYLPGIMSSGLYAVHIQSTEGVWVSNIQVVK